MGTFSDPLILQYGDGRDWQLVNPFPYYDDYAKKLYIVPAGFETDFASVPRFFWRFLPPTGRYGKAAVIHDFLYRTGTITRRDADRIFFDAMSTLGVGTYTRWLMWAAVRVFGTSSYNAPIGLGLSRHLRA